MWVMTDLGLFGPESVAWKVHSHPSALIGGLRALLVQALHPLAIAGVDQHSDYRSDPWGRMHRTADYMASVVFGDTATAQRAGAIVRKIHDRVSGVDPVTGCHYSANDPELLLWIHAAGVESFFVAYERYGDGVGDDDADRYVAEMVSAAELVGLHRSDIPGSMGELREYLDNVDDLQITPAAREGMTLILVPPLPLVLRPVWNVWAAAAVALLEPRHRAMYDLPWTPALDAPTHAVSGAALQVVRAVVGDPPLITDALERAGGAPKSAA